MKVLFQQNNVALIEFDTGHRHNPFSGKKMNQLEETIKSLYEKDDIKTIVLYGGKNKSFSVGGDFNEVSNFTGGEEVANWIDSVTNLYKSVLACPKPIIAAIDNYSIGFGLQLALVCDYRIGSTACELKMPEFAMGISCNFGGYLLEKLTSRSIMQEMLFNCEGIKAKEAKALGLLHATTDSEHLLDHAIKIAEKFASYHSTPIRETKKTLNIDMINELDLICQKAKIAHKVSFAARTAQDKMLTIIKKKI